MSQRNNLSFGCVALTTYSLKSRAIKMLELAYDNGITNFDTAPLYGRGYSEEIVGSFIRNKRSKVVVTTKVGLGSLNENSIPASIALPLYSLKRKLKKQYSATIKVPTELPKPLTYRKIDKKYIEQSLQLSLKRLKTDYIDNYFLHEALPSFITDEGWSYLQELKKKRNNS
ncbi:MAG: aldo/keto reductase [Chitinophagaceae bacterium]|nr:aldo/keto reductase [Chitinophagaceae bacterium]MCW5905674.1 aldo/keto reductase [Chitinophagaceae bacterium]